MNVLVSGAGGLIGAALSKHLAAAGHRIVALRRSALPKAEPWWNPASNEIDLSRAGTLDAVVHLAGESIGTRWTAAKKEKIRSSRVDATRLLVGALSRLETRPAILISASAIGYYGSRGDEILTEDSTPGTDFLADVCQEWEAAAALAKEHGIRVTQLRTGIVLAPSGGALGRMLPFFKMGLGGRIGDGRQFWSWIALSDAVRVIQFLLESNAFALAGPVNVVSPNPATNDEFTKTLGRVLGRPTLLPLPAFVARGMFGEMADRTLLGSTRVQPARLLAEQFQFHHPNLEDALRSVQ